MPRPCEKEHPQPQPDICRVCWLALNDHDYAEFYGENGASGAARPTTRRQRDPNKPRVSIGGLAAQNAANREK